MGFGPRCRLEVFRLALPWRRATVPRLAVPSRKVTEPLGVGPPRLRSLTVAVKVTGRPRFAGRGRAVRTVRVGAVPPIGPPGLGVGVGVGLMITVTIVPVLLGAKSAVPPYEAETVSVPAARLEVVNVATPLTSVALPIAPSWSL